MEMWQSFMVTRRLFIILVGFFILIATNNFLEKICMAKEQNSIKTKITDRKLNFFLVEPSIKPSLLISVPLSKITFAKEPFFTSDDMIAYNNKNHTFMLRNKIYGKFRKLDIPVFGRAFVVAVDRSPIYWGVFWSGFSSVSFEGVVIVQPFSETNEELKIQLGYPNENFFRGKDPRGNPEILEIIERSLGNIENGTQ